MKCTYMLNNIGFAGQSAVEMCICAHCYIVKVNCGLLWNYFIDLFKSSSVKKLELIEIAPSIWASVSQGIP